MTLSIHVMRDVQNIQLISPLVLNITNFVAMEFNANALLALGASPLMTFAVEEIEELVSISDAVVINIGTLSHNFIKIVFAALDAAQKFNKPVVFDPVGAGASSFRTRVTREIIQHPAVSIIRGNASEILNVCGASVRTKGVDSTQSSSDAEHLVQTYLTDQKSKLIIVVSGQVDFVVSQNEIITIEHGNRMMTQVTGMGCTATALIGAFVAVNTDKFEASTHAMTVMGISGENAKANSNGPGSFKVEFLDSLANLNQYQFLNLKIKKL